ncbi:hypothetical protein ARALYDRAFT_894011 [Arabidopsis lyrata subsp. lyrata]|uniref:Uncharacterized protein n=1 Tax=Arabidopsis lyrata subsp. lyrata TaxID=81972 RepID=D7KRF2_ARALL|nr:hypothetical protein ARALYDRAFT_894011 [Arabidopsis lyrata subsp. lyrata]
MKVLVCPRELELKYKKVPGLSSFGRAKGRSHAGAHDPRGGLANVLRVKATKPKLINIFKQLFRVFHLFLNSLSKT